jgi:hypothetical protein
MAIQANRSDLLDRDPSNFETDKAAVQAIVQAAVNVELFTIPLYMTSLYSIQGVHQITGSKSKLYQGRLWPGMAPSYADGGLGNIPENAKAFNTIFSVFIEEMFHLQLASNIATTVGIAPDFTLLSPKQDNYAWNCYGPDKTEIPYILDFKDCKEPYDKIRVKLDSLNLEHNELFLAIEEPEATADKRIKEENLHKYFPKAPFKNWAPGDPLPMFGSIGQMYQCLWDYFDITYKDAEGHVTTLWEKMYVPSSLQRDLFNTVSDSHPLREFQDLETTVEGWLPEKAKEIVFKMICAITDQGEGSGIKRTLRSPSPMMLQAVKPVNQASDVALKADYPSYDDSGEPVPSRDAYARYGNGEHDHYERFQEIRNDLLSGKIVTWDKWRTDQKDRWQASDLKGKDYDKNTYNLPPAEEVAAAMNRLANPVKEDGSPDEEKRAANYKQFCQIATGAIAGITTVLNDYWNNSKVGFPFPSMGGSGDRLMMCWAVFGEVPNLAVGVQPRKDGVLYHACQGMDLNANSKDVDTVCASPEIYHNCKGSNSCKAEGGCGFVQEVGKSSTCSASVKSAQAGLGRLHTCSATVYPEPLQAGCGLPAPAYSAPADNLCKSFGGCAVPISASQIYPEFVSPSGDKNIASMELNDFVGPQHTTQKLPGQVVFETGDFVYDIAWEAFTRVLANRDPKPPVPVKPKPSDIRLAFPPST